jgi:hypothetical protein
MLYRQRPRELPSSVNQVYDVRLTMPSGSYARHGEQADAAGQAR